jgi:hypothetical protein
MKVRDYDGDTWEQDEEGGWFFEESYLPDREILDTIWGPLSDVED